MWANLLACLGVKLGEVDALRRELNDELLALQQQRDEERERLERYLHGG